MITLINPPGLKNIGGLQSLTPTAPIGLAYIAGTLKASGREYSVIDGAGLGLDSIHPYPERDDILIQGLPIDEIVARIPRETTLIGVTCMFTSLWPLTLSVLKAIRQRFPDIPIIGGGEHATAVPEYILRVSPLDVVMIGEGEQTLLAFLDRWEKGQSYDDLPGIALIKSDGTIINNGRAPRNRAIDAIAWPDWDSFPIEEYIARNQTSGVNLGRSMPFMPTRGCPFKCTFCSSPDMWTTRYTTRAPKDIVDEMAHYVEKYQVTNFDFQDLTAVVKREWAIQLCREILDRGLKISFQMPSGTRSEVFDEEVADWLYRAGCRIISFAPESGSEEILQAVNKRISLDNLFKAIRIALKRGFNISCFFVIGFPEDTPQTLRDSMKMIRKLAVIGVHDVAVSKFIPYPGSVMFRRLQDEGKIEMDDAFFISPMDFYTDKAPSYSDSITGKQLYRTMILMFCNFYILSFILRPFRVMGILWRAVFKGQEETRYAKWFIDRFFTRQRWRSLQSKG